MTPNALNWSRALALILGVATPLAETERRWSSWRDDIPAILDDYLLGALLLWGAWSVGRNPRQGRAILACAWGFTCGIGYSSFFEQIRASRLGEPDPSSLPSEWILAVKGGGLAIAMFALALTLLARDGKD